MKQLLARLIRARPFRNAVSLYVLMLGERIIPLIILPYVLRILGPEGYGRVAFARSYVVFLIIVVNYGFDWSATRAIAQRNERPESTSRVASTVWAAKSVIAGICMVVGTAIAASVAPLRAHLILILVLFGEVVREVLNPKWAFRGFERMGFLPMINLGCRVLEIAAVLMFVKAETDVLAYAWIIGLRSILVGLVGAVVAVSIFDLSLIRLRVVDVWNEMRDATLLFLSSASEQVMRNSTAFLLGLIGGPEAVGIFRPIEQVVRAGLRVLDPLSQAVFPWLTRMSKASGQRFSRWGQRLIAINLGLGLVMTAFVMFGSELGVSLLMGQIYENAVTIAMVLGLLPIMVAASKSTGIQILLPLGQDRRFTIAQVMGLVSLLVLTFVLVEGSAEPEVLMAVTVVIAEAVIALICAFQALSVYQGGRSQKNFT